MDVRQKVGKRKASTSTLNKKENSKRSKGQKGVCGLKCPFELNSFYSEKMNIKQKVEKHKVNWTKYRIPKV